MSVGLLGVDKLGRTHVTVHVCMKNTCALTWRYQVCVSLHMCICVSE